MERNAWTRACIHLDLCTGILTCADFCCLTCGCQCLHWQSSHLNWACICLHQCFTQNPRRCVWAVATAENLGKSFQNCCCLGCFNRCNGLFCFFLALCFHGFQLCRTNFLWNSIGCCDGGPRDSVGPGRRACLCHRAASRAACWCCCCCCYRWCSWSLCDCGTSATCRTCTGAAEGACAATGGATGTGAAATTGGATGAGAAATTGGATGTGAAATTGGATGTGAAATTATTGGATGTGAAATTGGATGRCLTGRGRRATCPASTASSTRGASGSGGTLTRNWFDTNLYRTPVTWDLRNCNLKS